MDDIYKYIIKNKIKTKEKNNIKNDLNNQKNILKKYKLELIIDIILNNIILYFPILIVLMLSIYCKESLWNNIRQGLIISLIIIPYVSIFLKNVIKNDKYIEIGFVIEKILIIYISIKLIENI